MTTNNIFKMTDSTNTQNSAGGNAYSLDGATALAQYVCTGVFNSTYNDNATQQQATVLDLCKKTEPEFIAKLAIYSRKKSQMKDMPSLLIAYLANNNIDLCKKVFNKVIDNPKMLRNFVSLLRSGVVGRKSLGTAPKNLVKNYLNNLTDEQLFRADIGNKPSLSDIIKMVHPKPTTKEREALYSYIIGNKPKAQNKESEKDKNYLLDLVQEFEAFKKDKSLPIPNVPFQMLTSLSLSDDNWKSIAKNCTFNQIRQNIATFKRHNVFSDPEMVKFVADKLSNKDEIRKSRVLPYQLFITYLNVGDVEQSIKNALQEAINISLENVPVIDGNIAIALDISSSMTWQAMGNKHNASIVKYMDIAALFTAAIIRNNKNAELIPFNTEVQIKNLNINPHDSVMTNAYKLSKMACGGTDCSVALAHLNKRHAKMDAVIYISDNESWSQYNGKRPKGAPTGMMEEWSLFIKENENAKLINIDISPNVTNQMPNRNDTLLVGGFSDEVFYTIADFIHNNGDKDFWIKTINEIKL